MLKIHKIDQQKLKIL